MAYIIKGCEKYITLYNETIGKRRLLPIVCHFEVNDEIDSKTVQKLTGKGKTTAVSYLNRLCDLEVLEKDEAFVSTVYRLKQTKN